MKRTLLAIAFSLLVTSLAHAQVPNAWFNELHYDNTGGDTDEFVEVVVENSGSFDLSTFEVVLYNGRDKEEYDSEILNNFTIEDTENGFTFFSWSKSGIQNGAPDGLVLCHEGNLIQFLSYEGTFTASGGCADGETSTDIGVQEGGSTLESESLQLTGSGSTYVDFTWTGPVTATKGALNTGQTLGSLPVTNVTQGTSYSTIQAALDAASTGDEIHIANGTYPESLKILTDDLTITGDSEGGVVVNTAASGYGVDIAADGVTLEQMTINGPSDDASNSYGIKAQGESTLPSEDRMEGLTLRHLTVQGSGRSEFDLNGVDNATLENLTANGQGTKGNGLGLTDVTNVTVNTLSTDGNNAWGGIAVYTYGRYFTGGTDNVSITGNNASESNPLYTQVGNYNDSSAPYAVTNLSAPIFDYAVRNPAFRSGAPNFTFYQKTQSDAVAYAVGLLNPPAGLPGSTPNDDSYLQTISHDSGVISIDNAFIVGTSGGTAMSIQTAVDAATGGAPPEAAKASGGPTINVLAGTYNENITLDQALTLQGASGDSGTVAPKATTASCTAGTIIDASGGNIGVDIMASNVTLSTLCVTDAQAHNVYTDAVISDITLNSVEALNAGNQGFEIHNNAVMTTLSITGSTFSGNNIGMRIRGSVDGLDVSGSSFDGNNFGFYTTHGGDASGATNVNDVSVTSTTFNGNARKGLYAEKLDNASFEGITVDGSGASTSYTWPAGIDINLKYRTYTSLSFSNATIQNSGTGDASNGVGLTVKARNDGSYASAPASLASVTVTNSTIATNQSGAAFGNNIQSASVTGSLIASNTNAGLSYYVDTGSSVELDAHQNCIIENGAVGLESTAETVDATDNWWGSAGGPGDDGANGVSGPVDADPFATDPVSGVEGCGAPTGECLASDFSATVVSNTPPGQVELDVGDPEGIAQVNFYLLDNFTVASTGFADGDNDNVWTPTSGMPTSATFTLTQADTNNPDASYFAKITNDCGTVTDIDPPVFFELSVPTALDFAGSYPNPFAGRTTIAFTLPEQTDVTLSVYDVTGRRVATLANESMPAGTHRIHWNGRSDDGKHLASGLYLMRLETGDQTLTGRMTLVR